ncbi:hypothetical protein VRB37_16610 [Erwinia billingiae]|uniref:hypothetical protein n=1 Tax=Erwinia billingiae TaxID=182337 RepID=UPI0030CC4BC3
MSDLNKLKELAKKAGFGHFDLKEFLAGVTPGDVITLFDRLEAAQQRIAELESRESRASKLVTDNETSWQTLCLRLEAAEAELARRDAAAGEAIHFYREHNPTNGMKTDWIEVDSIQFGFLQDSTDPDTAEFRTLYTAAQPLALQFDIEPLLERALKLHGLRTAEVGHSQLSDGFRNGARWAAKALGCKAIKLPEPYDDGHGNEWIPRSATIQTLKALGFTVEGE